MVSIVAPTYSLKGKPHWRRTQQVYSLLNQAPPGATYDRLIDYVRGKTGKGCSRKLISKWKKLTIQDRAVPPSSPNSQSKTAPQEITPASEARVNIEQLPVKDEPLVTETHSPVEPTLETNEAEPDLIQNPKSKIQNPLRERVLQVARGTWSYVAATTIVVGLAGFSWFLSKDNSQPVIAQPAAVTQTAPAPRLQKLEPRTIKIHLTLSNPQDLKVKPGDDVTPGQVLSDRTTERQRLLSQKKQLQLSLNKLDVPIPELIPPEPIPGLGKLPPVSYQQEEANIALKQQELAEAEKANCLQQRFAPVNQQEKIRQLSELLPATQPAGTVTADSEIATLSIPLPETEAEYHGDYYRTRTICPRTVGGSQG